MENFSLRQARSQIVSFINGLPYSIEIKRLLVKDIYEEIKQVADKTCEQEYNDAQQALKEKEEQDAENVQQDNMGELSEHRDTTE